MTVIWGAEPANCPDNAARYPERLNDAAPEMGSGLYPDESP
jgi:hypothetical protein